MTLVPAPAMYIHTDWQRIDLMKWGELKQVPMMMTPPSAPPMYGPPYNGVASLEF